MRRLRKSPFLPPPQRGGLPGALRGEHMSSTSDYNEQAPTTNNPQQSGRGADRMQNGYRENQGGGYDEEPHSPTSVSNEAAARSQQGYDPTHSGVRQSKNQPGERVDAPGRETGTAWGQDIQMGSATDTPDRKNPAD
jgi:hypothetical protein